jgi:ABC-type sugar transport system ATPase subunit
MDVMTSIGKNKTSIRLRVSRGGRIDRRLRRGKQASGRVGGPRPVMRAPLAEGRLAGYAADARLIASDPYRAVSGFASGCTAAFASARANFSEAQVCLIADRVWTAHAAVKNVSLRVRAGEVVGIAGDAAGGLTALAAACLGSPTMKGVIRVRGALHAGLGSPDGDPQCAVHVVNEPFAQADPAQRVAMAARLAARARAGAGLLVLSRDLSALAACVDRLLLMREGRLIAEFDSAELHGLSLPETLHA